MDRAADVPDCGGLYLVPAFPGLGAPHEDQHAHGSITGMTRRTTAEHIARAAHEGFAFQVSDVLEVMHADSAIPVHEPRVDGRASANNLLMQFEADQKGVAQLMRSVNEIFVFSPTPRVPPG
jgi:glycerol kinase